MGRISWIFPEPREGLDRRNLQRVNPPSGGLAGLLVFCEYLKMVSPKISNDGTDKQYSFEVACEHTGELIAFLRQRLSEFSVEIGGITVRHSDMDVFHVPGNVEEDVLARLLAEFFGPR